MILSSSVLSFVIHERGFHTISEETRFPIAEAVQTELVIVPGYAL